MKNKIILIAGMAALLLASGCSGDINGENKNEALNKVETLSLEVSSQDVSNREVLSNDTLSKDIRTTPSLGGISLGD